MLTGWLILNRPTGGIKMSSTAVAPQPVVSANQYKLQDSTGKTKITYYPFAPGPLLAGQAPGPELAYVGAAGNQSFRGSQVEAQQSPLGQMITVNLKAQPDTGFVTLTVFLPTVVMGSSKSEPFKTFCVTAHKPGNILKTGSQITYEIERMEGAANIVALPL
jgi:hypothetical protein